MGVNKQGIWTANNIYESHSMNIQYQNNFDDCINRIYSLTPHTGNNSCMRDIIIHGESYPLNEPMHVRFKVKWNGFDTSNTDGEFNIYFQGYYKKDDGTNVWSTKFDVSAKATQNLRDLVLSSTQGEYIYDFSYSNINFLIYEGIRSNYSNGTATIEFSDIVVIPEKYYIASTVTPPPRKFYVHSYRERLYFSRRIYRILTSSVKEVLEYECK